MKKVITMVGTSIFENCLKNSEKDIKPYYEALKEKRFKDCENEKDRIKRLKRIILDWFDREIKKEDTSAEIKSLVKLKQEIKEDFEIYLLHSDTILSYLAGEIIKEKIKDIKEFENLEEDYIKLVNIEYLQIWNRKEFNKGMSNLISKVYEITQGYWQNIIINITGGYKATIPYLTILAQINGCPVYYIFEDTDALIKIPNIPFSSEWYDLDRLGKYEEELKMLEKGIYRKDDFAKIKNSEFYKEFSFLIWEDDIDGQTIAELNPIGRIIYEKYKEKYFSFYCTEEASSKIESDEKLKLLIMKQFSNKQIRKSKTEKKNEHLVYDAGDNSLRLFYREKENNIYIYKAFNNHDEYIRYLEKTPYSEDLLNQSFILKRIKKEG